MRIQSYAPSLPQNYTDFFAHLSHACNTCKNIVAAVKIGNDRGFIPGGPIKTEQSILSIFQDFALIKLSFFTLLDRASFLHLDNTMIIKFG